MAVVCCPVTEHVRTWVVEGGRGGYCSCPGQRCYSAGPGCWQETWSDMDEFKKYVGARTPNAGAGSAVRSEGGTSVRNDSGLWLM